MHRSLLAGLAALFVVTGGTANAQVSDDVVKIGVLTDMSGPASAPTGPGSVAAAEMAVADFGGSVLGRSVQILQADCQNKPNVAAAIARQWVDDDGVDVMREQPADRDQAGGVCVVADDRIRLELLGRHLKIVSTCPGQGDRVAGVAEPLCNDATQFRVAPGD